MAKYRDHNTLIGPYIGVAVKPPPTAMGIEVEVEFTQDHEDTWQPKRLTNWTQTNDGSLRGFSREYKTPPLTFKQVMPAITRLFEDIEPHIRDTDESRFRTSIHVHVNNGYKTIGQVSSNLMAFYLLEAYLMEIVSPARRNNIYCRKVAQSATNIEAWVEFLVGRSNINGQKYTAQNYNALYKFGTVEYRMYPGLYKKAPLRTWVSFLQNLSVKTFDDKTITPGRLYDLAWNGKMEELLDLVMTDTCPYRKRILKLFRSEGHDFREFTPFAELHTFANALDWDVLPFKKPSPPASLMAKYDIKEAGVPTMGE